MNIKKVHSVSFLQQSGMLVILDAEAGGSTIGSRQAWATLSQKDKNKVSICFSVTTVELFFYYNLSNGLG